jgi:hypothetical protein
VWKEDVGIITGNLHATEAKNKTICVIDERMKKRNIIFFYIAKAKFEMMWF